MQHIHPADFDDIGTGAADIGAHGIEKVGKVYNVGFFGNILQHGHTAGFHGGQHDIDGGADRNLIEVDVRPLQALGISVDETVFDADLGTQQLEALDVLIDGTNAEIAPAGHGNTGLAKTPQQRADEIIAGTHVLGELVGDGGFGEGGSIDNSRSAAELFHCGAHGAQHTEQQLGIMDVGDIFQHTAAAGQHGGGNNGNGGIFRAAGGNFSVELLRAVYNEFLHWAILVIFYIFDIMHSMKMTAY